MADKKVDGFPIASGGSDQGCIKSCMRPAIGGKRCLKPTGTLKQRKGRVQVKCQGDQVDGARWTCSNLRWLLPWDRWAWQSRHSLQANDRLELGHLARRRQIRRRGRQRCGYKGLNWLAQDGNLAMQRLMR